MKEELFSDLQQLGVDMEEIMDRFMEDKELYITCLKKFMNEKTFLELKERLQEKDYENAFNCAHSLKGVSANLGLHHLFDAVCELVEPLRARKDEGLLEKYAKIMEEKEKVEQAIANNQDA